MFDSLLEGIAFFNHHVDGLDEERGGIDRAERFDREYKVVADPHKFDFVFELGVAQTFARRGVLPRVFNHCAQVCGVVGGLGFERNYAWREAFLELFGVGACDFREYFYFGEESV